LQGKKGMKLRSNYFKAAPGAYQAMSGFLIHKQGAPLVLPAK
jgi:hypothetical protein